MRILIALCRQYAKPKSFFVYEILASYTIYIKRTLCEIFVPRLCHSEKPRNATHEVNLRKNTLHNGTKSPEDGYRRGSAVA